ncbi:MAG: hypothetical protein JSS67_08540 [Bacteroidetes bacterium]|nr:hypothetical protein [Bacteroidota bacterium]
MKFRSPSQKDKAEISSHIFTGAISMAGVSVTVIALFRVLKMNTYTYADEILSFNLFILLTSAFLAYTSLRQGRNKKLELVADILFFLGMILMLIVGIIIVYTSY